MTAPDEKKQPSVFTQPIQIFEKPMEPSRDEFAKLKDYIYESCGIALGADKLYLISQRLGPLARKAGCRNFTEFYRKLKEESPSSGAMKDRVVEAITTNETSFFRDVHPFESFRDTLLQEMVRRILHWAGAILPCHTHN